MEASVFIQIFHSFIKVLPLVCHRSVYLDGAKIKSGFVESQASQLTVSHISFKGAQRPPLS